MNPNEVRVDLETMSDDLIKDVRYLWIPNAKLPEFYETPVIITRGKGALIWDTSGKEYIDALSGLCNVTLGHADKRVMDAIRKQMENLVFVSPAFAANIPAIRLAKKLVTISQWKVGRVFFTSGGSEANESAFKIARQYHFLNGNKGKYRVISRWGSYHGATSAALSATGNPNFRKVFQPLLLDFPHISPVLPYGVSNNNPEEYGKICADELESTIKAEGADSISAFIAEPIQWGGTLIPPDNYFPLFREVCDKYDILMILDEVVTGFGKTGKMFACEHWKTYPDLLTFGKGATSGYSPLGGVLVSERIADVFSKEVDEPFMHVFTYGGNPVSCAASLACIDIIERDKLVERAAEIGRYMLKRLDELYRFRSVGDVRGKGLMVGIEFFKDKDTKKLFPESEEFGETVSQTALERGVRIMGAKGVSQGYRGDIVGITPPLMISQEHVDRIIKVITEGIVEAEKQFPFS